LKSTSINNNMRKQRYNTSDNDLIWESLVNKTQHKSNEQLKELWEQDLSYIEQFLIDEGLMDTVKKGFGAVKDFAADKLLKPVMNFLAGIIAKDPQLAQKAQAAAAQGPEALQQLANTEGDPSVAQQLQGGAHGESYSYVFNMNQMICDALVEEQLITSQHAQVIQEKYFRATINEMHEQLRQDAGCPWIPANIVSESAKGTAQKILDLFAQERQAGRFRPGETFDALQKLSPQFAKYVQRQGTPQASAEADADQNGDGQPDSAVTSDTGDSSSPDGGQTPPPLPQSDATADDGVDPNIDPAAGGKKGPGLISKVWNFIKSNKGAIGGAAAMGLAAAIAASTGNPMAFSYLVGGLVGGAKGAIQGATQTQGGFVDKLKGAANQAGADSMKAGGLAAAASGIGQMASNAAGGAPSTGGEVADAGGTQGGEEFVEPTRPTPDQLKQMNIDAGVTPGGMDPATGTSVDDISDADAAAFNAANPEPETSAAGPVGPAGPAGQEQLPYDPDQEAGVFQRSGVDQYHRDEFEKSLSPREKMQLRPGTRGYETSFRNYLKNAQTPI